MPTGNLPSALSSFIGREREILAVQQSLADSRLVTLVGPSGVGKTRLALEVASAVDEPDGVWFLELAPIADARLVPHAVAAALGVREQAGRTLADALRHQQQLLLLDNCEHLVSACAELANTLLRACPGLRILVTSHEPLRLCGETTWRVSPLPEQEATQLFVVRAQSAQPDLGFSRQEMQAVANICNRLDGIPLALELAAARVASLGVEQLAQRLDDRFRVLVGGSRAALPRHQTLLALVDWGYALLSPAEQLLLRRLSVFSDGWSLEAAEAICAGDGLDQEQVLPLLLNLVDKSHVVRDKHCRYRLLETLREYAAEKLRGTGETSALRQRHLEWFAHFAEQAEDLLWGPHQPAWFDRLKLESNNLRAALQWSETAAECPEFGPRAVHAGLRLGAALWHFWNLRGHLSEGQARLLALLHSGVEDVAVRAKALHAVGYLTFVRGQAAEGSRLAAQSVAFGPDAIHPFLRASSLTGLALGMLMGGDPVGATALCEEGLHHCERVGDRRGKYYSLYGLAEIARAGGNIARAIELMEQAHRLTLEQADAWSIAFALSILGNLTLAAGDLPRSTDLQRESLRLRQGIDDRVGIARCLDGLSWVASARGQLRRAARLFGAADALRERVGSAPHPLWQSAHARYRGETRTRLGDLAFHAELAQGAELELERAVAYALADDPVVATRCPASIPGGLSAREREVAVLVAHGFSNRAIAETLVITERTAEGHVERIRGKLGFQSRAQVAAWAVQHDLLAA